MEHAKGKAENRTLHQSIAYGFLPAGDTRRRRSRANRNPREEDVRWQEMAEVRIEGPQGVLRGGVGRLMCALLLCHGHRSISQSRGQVLPRSDL
ncbi:hypothetical protein E2C01_054351 [Portunus trituberculatus]|uniref:Uncharacterized protein n=1 Tax=Portunus trituberculatus TaxID=210409 RepID=A0A5B7GJ51_PORTR|nr:hypothetical protein [Portunus trituberculatus]